MLSALIINNKLNDQTRNEYNYYRAYKMTDAFILDQPWSELVNKNNKLSSVQKEDIVNFANKYFNDNYIVVNKLHGAPNSIRVQKPAITNVPINRDTSSFFASEFNNMQSKRLNPVFNDYSQDIQSFSLNNSIPGYYVKNTTNQVFSLSYIFEMGKWSDLELALAIEYLEYLGTDKYSAQEIEKELFKLGLNYNVFVSNERVYVRLSGLEESFESGLKLFEHILKNVQPDQVAYNNLVEDILRTRQDNKKSKWEIKSRMREYAKYGINSPSKHFLTLEELNNMEINNLINKIHSLSSFEHYIYYYGQNSIDTVKQLLTDYHIVPSELTPVLKSKNFIELNQQKNKVYFSNYDMVQSEITMLSKGAKYNKDLIAPARLFNEYFGSGLSSIVFQEIRESKALAYSAGSYFSTPDNLNKSHYVTAYL